ncbi:hypothetical protein [Nocardia cyriacigeorgica]|jgi:hypothetical protein|uniref:hypothetical protein n=1 Tax=Nocardia cyriacigeorgica TaxID=135487 RepID=UPI0018957E62|nr:hypothetical protein [Nocardia cyriacigeorgica]MBF6453108.1 hypothetical protein [Nocardia cyriacigeorgica]MBF6478738.1 hypothetical protein [Nocardia cyriacigeorgica]MBF6550277.1 hypothetical protein [Nocardia cyriacigeorgica]
MRKTVAAVAVTAALLVPAQLAGSGIAAADPVRPVSTGSAEMPPSCVGKINPIVFFLQSLSGTQPRHCL